jgi:hypothetical protein
VSFLKPEKDVVFCERFKAIRHPLSECRHGLEHDRLRQLYIELLEQCVGHPLEQARQMVIHEILQSYMHDHTTVSNVPIQTAIYQTKLAISSLALLMCDLEKGDLHAAAKSLEATHQSLQIVSDYLNKAPEATEVLA